MENLLVVVMMILTTSEVEIRVDVIVKRVNARCVPHKLPLQNAVCV